MKIARRRIEELRVITEAKWLGLCIKRSGENSARLLERRDSFLIPDPEGVQFLQWCFPSRYAPVPFAPDLKFQFRCRGPLLDMEFVHHSISTKQTSFENQCLLLKAHDPQP